MNTAPQERTAMAPAMYAASRVWAQVAGAVLFLTASVKIGPSGFGEFAIALSIFTALSVFVGQGTYEYVMKARDSENAAPTAFLLNLATATTASLLAIAIGFVIPHIVESKSIGAILMLLTPAFFLAGLNSGMESLTMKHGKIANVAIACLLAETVALGVAMAALFSGIGVFALVIHRVTREGMLLFSYLVSRRWRPRFVLDFKEARTAARFARNIVATRFTSYGTAAVVDVMIGAALSTADAGLFRLVNRLLTMGSDILFQPFRASMWVSLPLLQNDRDAFGKKAFSLLEVFGTGLFATMVGAILLAGPLVPLVLDERWVGATAIVPILALQRVFSLPLFLVEMVFSLRNRTGFMAVTALVSASTYIAVAFVAAPFGLKVFTIATAVVSIAQLTYIIPALSQCTGVSPLSIFKQTARIGLNAVVMYVVTAPWVAFAPTWGVTGWWLVATSILLGAATYILAASRFTPLAYQAYMDVVAEAARRSQGLLSRKPA